jgi:uncharacterized glyoxalase superfamily protein PhnB
LTVPGVTKLLAFLKRAFDAQVIGTMNRPDGTVQHAQVRIGDSIVMMGEPQGEVQAKPGNLYLYVEDVDAVYQRAIQAGAAALREPADQFYGDRSGGIRDPSGNDWYIATRIEDLSLEEIRRRAAALAG